MCHFHQPQRFSCCLHIFFRCCFLLSPILCAFVLLSLIFRYILRQPMQNNEGKCRCVCVCALCRPNLAATQWVRIMLRILLSLQSIAHHGIDCLVSWKWDGVRDSGKARAVGCSFPIGCVSEWCVCVHVFSSSAHLNAYCECEREHKPHLRPPENAMRKKERSKIFQRIFVFFVVAVVARNEIEKTRQIYLGNGCED